MSPGGVRYDLPVPLLRWLRETSTREVPDWMRNGGVVGVFGILILLRFLGFGWLETILVAMVVGVGLASVAKLIWAAANPLSEDDDARIRRQAD